MVSENEKLREALKNAFDGDDVATKNIALRKAYDALSTPCVEQDADEAGEHKRCPWCRSRPLHSGG